MKINSIVFESRLYLYEGLTLTERKSVKLWESAGKKLFEANLTQDQIMQLFQQIEQGANAAGNNRTLIGKGKDVATSVNRAWEDLKTKVQNSGPIKNMDAMYDQAAEKLKQATGGDEGVMKYVQMYRDFAKKHPTAQSLIYAALIAGAGVSGAGLGGAAALGLFKMVDKLLQGEKFSSATYSGAKTGAMAYGASKLGDLARGSAASTIDVDNDAIDTKSSDSFNDPERGASVDKPEMAKDLDNDIRVTTRTMPNVGDVDQSGEFYEPGSSGGGDEKFAQQTDVDNTDVSDVNVEKLEAHPAYKDALEKYGDTPEIKDAARELAKAAMLSGELTESQVKRLFSNIEQINRQLNEGIWDKIKGAAGSVANKAAGAAKTFGQNLTTKITADKLMTAWKKSGSPTDSTKIMGILRYLEVPDAIINQAFSTLNTKSDSAPTTSASTTSSEPTPTSDDDLDRIKKNAGLNSAGEKSFGQMATRLGKPSAAKIRDPKTGKFISAKTIGTPANVPTGGAGAFSQMTSALRQPEASSSGGSITQTPTGVVHRAKKQAIAT